MNESEAAGALAIFAGLGIFMLVIGLAVHFFIGYCYKLIAEKTGNTDVAWMWWIPLVNYWIPTKVAGKPMLWFLIILSPVIVSVLSSILVIMGMEGIGSILGILTWPLIIAALVMAILIWMNVAEARGHEKWWGILAVIVWFVGIPYLAFADSTSPATATSGGA